MGGAYVSGEDQRAHQAHLQRERQEKIRQRRLESKHVDHLDRACREEEFHLPDALKEKLKRDDQAYLDQAEEKITEEQKTKYKESLVGRDMLNDFQIRVEELQEIKIKKQE